MMASRTASLRWLAPLLLGLAACSDGGETIDSELLRQARRLARETLIVDTHIDVPYRLHEEMADISQATEDGDFDYPRAVAGGLDAAFMSIYIPASYQETGGAKGSNATRPASSPWRARSPTCGRTRRPV